MWLKTLCTQCTCCTTVLAKKSAIYSSIPIGIRLQGKHESLLSGRIVPIPLDNLYRTLERPHITDSLFGLCTPGNLQGREYHCQEIRKRVLIRWPNLKIYQLAVTSLTLGRLNRDPGSNIFLYRHVVRADRIGDLTGTATKRSLKLIFCFFRWCIPFAQETNNFVSTGIT